MKRCLVLIFFFFCLAVRSWQVAPEEMILKNTTRAEGNILHLNGKQDYAQIQKTEDWNLGKEGLTLACAVKLDGVLRGEPANERFDMFFSRTGVPFIFSRYGSLLYANIKNEQGKFVAETYASKLPEMGQWSHVAVVFAYYNDEAQGDIGYTTTIYLNGTPVGRGKHKWLKPLQTKGLLDIGKGWGGPWFLHGQVSEVNIEKRALNEAEITALVDQSKLVKAASRRKINPGLKKFRAASPTGKWVLQALHNAPAENAVRTAAELQEAFQTADDRAFLKKFGRARHGIRLLAGRELLVLLDTAGNAGTPILGAYDRIAGRPVLEDRIFGWNIRALRGKKRVEFSADDLKYRILNCSARKMTAEWQFKNSLTVRASYAFTDRSISGNLKIQNRDAGLRLDKVLFPDMRFHKAAEKDTLLYPFQCGVLVQNPRRNSFKHGQSGRYPSSSMSMQFTGYYGGGRGSYLGWEDPHGTTKTVNVYGKRDGVEVQWEQTAAFALNQKNGGNSYATPGNVHFEVYEGGWFEACRIHRRQMKNADWAVKTLPRSDTPAWFRDIPVMVDGSVPRDSIVPMRYAQIMFLRKYFETPVYVSMFAWNDPAKGGWPVFEPRQWVRSFITNLRRGDCYPEPYIDSRLWAVKDGPYGKSDARYSTHGKKFAVKLADGSIPMETYGTTVYATMCPQAAGWQKELLDLTARIASFAPAVYHDQVAAGAGFPCFDPSHGHLLNDASCWLNQGYRPLLERMHKTHPETVFTTEEISEAYLNLFDGGHVWRWTFDGQVPAFQAIYGGRCQYLALTYNSHGKGEYASNFVKMANSLVNGLKLGKFQCSEFYHADAKRLFAKKMVHLRKCLTRYFNEGEMLKPIEFSEPLPLLTTQWANNSRFTEPVTMPKIISNSYLHKGNRVYIFINTVPETQSFSPVGLSGRLCLEGASAPVPFRGVIHLKGYQTALVVSAPEPEIRRIQADLQRIGTFTPGLSFESLVQFDKLKEIAPAEGQLMGVKESSGCYNCSKSEDGKFFGNTADGALISYGVVDFGTRKVSKLYVTVAVPEAYAGGTFDILTGPSQDISQVVGTFTVPATGGWTVFKEFGMTLKHPLTGKSNFRIRFNRNGCCNLAGWRY